MADASLDLRVVAGSATEDITIHYRPDATVADLARALAEHRGAGTHRAALRAWGATPARHAGRHLAPEVALRDAGLVRGMTVDLDAGMLADPGSPPPEPRPTRVRVDIVGGITAGGSTPLPAGTHVLGRAASNAVVVGVASVSARHLAVHVGTDAEVRVEDLGATNGSSLRPAHGGEVLLRPYEPVALPAGATLRIGAVELAIRGPLGVPATAGTGRHPFHRRPPVGRPRDPEPVVLPGAPATPPTGSPFSWATLLAPIALGIGMAVLFDPRMAAFVLLSPVMVVGSWFEDRRRGRRARVAAATARRARLAQVRDDLQRSAAAEVRRRRELQPDPVTLAARAWTCDARLWERRTTHVDAFVLPIGTARQRWSPPCTRPGGATDPDAERLLAEAPSLDDAVLTVDLGPGRVVGIAGDRATGRRVARQLVVATCVLHGPADLALRVVTDAPWAWAWSHWLPHRGRPRHGQVPRNADPDAPLELVVLDLDDPGAPSVRAAIAGADAAIVLAATADALPTTCTEVVELHGTSGRGRHTTSGTTDHTDDVRLAGCTLGDAAAVARALAPWTDPEAVGDVGLPDAVGLGDLLGGLDEVTILRRWEGSAFRAPLGVHGSGAFELDLLTDGPHGLVGGTTGSGKSELLRTLVASLAATADPERLGFVLIDYKGGSAFDACAALPHTLGLVTDLDGHLARRALTCLEAELRRRERILRDAGVDDLVALHAGPALAGPVPRLLVVIDEFAAMVSDLPEFVDALVDIAQRGRSLGVHLVLATQRPNGVINDNIRANTALRIALRMQDDADATDVVGTTAPAALPRSRPGRAVLRLGPGELVTVQTARITGMTDAPTASPVRVEPFGAVAGPSDLGPDTEITGPTDLERLVAACVAAASTRGCRPSAAPWPPPLPDRVPVVGLPQGTVALVDIPDQQAQHPLPVDVATSQLLVGAAGMGPTHALAAIAVAAASTAAVEDLHLYVVDLGPGDLAPLACLPHVGAYIAADERDRQQRLIDQLTDELAARRRDEDRRTRIVVLIDNLAALTAAFDDVAGFAVLDRLERLIADGPGLGVSTVLTADRSGAIPGPISSVVTRRWIFSLADPYDHAVFGLRADDVPPTTVGRALDTTSGHELQIVDVIDDLAGHVARVAAATARHRAPGPRTVGRLDEHVALAPLLLDLVPPDPDGGAVIWRLPFGLRDRDLAPAVLVLERGDHALVAGGTRSGRSTLLATIALAARATVGGVTVTTFAPRVTPILEHGDVGHQDRAAFAAGAAAVLVTPGPQLVLIDDADDIEDTEGAFAALLSTSREDLHVVVGARTDDLRRGYGHWTQQVRGQRRGVLLRPQTDGDGDLWQVPLPRRPQHPFPVGRGYLVQDGTLDLVQVATP